MNPLRRFDYFGLVTSFGSIAILLVLYTLDAPRWTVASAVFVPGLAIGAWGFPSFLAVFFPNLLSVRKIESPDFFIREERFWGRVPGHSTLRASDPSVDEFVPAYFVYASVKLPNEDALVVQLSPWIFDAVFASRNDAEKFLAGLSKHNGVAYYLRLIPFLKFLDLRASARGKRAVAAQIILSGIICASAIVFLLIE